MASTSPSSSGVDTEIFAHRLLWDGQLERLWVSVLCTGYSGMVNSGGSGSPSCAQATLGWSTRAALGLRLVHRLLWDGQLGRLWVSVLCTGYSGMVNWGDSGSLSCAQATLVWSTRAALGLWLLHRLLWYGQLGRLWVSVLCTGYSRMVNSGGSGSPSCAQATLGWSTRAALGLCLVHRLLWDGQLGRLWISVVHRLLWYGQLGRLWVSVLCTGYSGMVNWGGSGSLSCAHATLGWSTRAALGLCLVHRLLWDGQLGRLWVSVLCTGYSGMVNSGGSGSPSCAQATLGWSDLNFWQSLLRWLTRPR